MTETPPHLRPFVLEHEPVEPVRSGELDLYLPADVTTPAPGVLMVHGGPVPPDRLERPPSWPSFRGYGALLAQAGVVAGMFEHSLTSLDRVPDAVGDVRRALAALRADERVDAGRVALWCFSGSGFLLGSLLAGEDRVEVGAVAGTYLGVIPPGGWDDEPGERVAAAAPQAVDVLPQTDIPLLLVRPELDFDWIDAGTEILLDRCREARRHVEVIEVPGAHHGFETVDDTDAVREAIGRSVAWVVDQLR